MKYTEIKIKTNTLGSEILGDILEELTGEGVSIYDKRDLETSSWDYKDDKVDDDFDEEVIINGYVKAQEADAVIKELKSRTDSIRECGVDLGSLEIALSEKESDNWRDVWKQHFRPIEIDNIVICPEWIDYDNKEGKTVIRIDPGFAFGTGEHETTSMVLALMQEIELNGKTVADVGCGSGILGITAHLLGAKNTVLTDLDPQAVEASQKNAQLNGCENQLQIVCADLLSVMTERYDVVLANLTADILEKLAVDIDRSVHNGTFLILSGILDTKLEQVENTYCGLGFEIVQRKAKGEWRALLLKK